MIQPCSSQHPQRPAVDLESTPLVFVVDDDISVRESLELLLRSVGLKTQTFSSGHDFLVSAQPCGPSCAVLDMSLPDTDGLALQQRLSTDRAGTPIVFLTGHADIPTTVRAMKAGAVEFFAKPVQDEALLDAIHSALEVSRGHLRRGAEATALRGRHASLTPREAEVMGFVVAGRLNKQIAAELGISEITVKAHRGKMMRKMMARSVPDLVKMAAKLGMTA